jgi:signal transduction histidine kinase
VTGFWWFVAGFAAAAAVCAPAMRLLLRRAEARAREAERRARTAERLAELGSMTGGLAHEIKNPLSTIGLNAQLLGEAIAESDMPVTQRERLLRRLESLRREADRLRDILTDFLQFAGRIRLDAQETDLVRVIVEIADFFHPQCERTGVLLRTRLPGGPVRIPLDEGLFKQALLNLMINATQAIAAARPSGEQVRGELILELDERDGAVDVHVIDTGPGIDPKRVDEIFRPYVSGRTGGTGLGLPIARRIIEEHGGNIRVVSEPGRGSDFVIELPRGQAAARN